MSCEFPVAYCLYDYGDSQGSWKKSKTIDLSLSGMKLAVHPLSDFPSSGMCYFKISLPEEELFKTTGKIRWMSEIKEDIVKHAGVQFITIRDDEKNKIARCIYV